VVTWRRRAPGLRGRLRAGSALAGRAGLVNAYFVVLFQEAAIGAAAYAAAATLRLHDEETAGRADPVLAAPVGRTRWAAGHVLTAVAGPAVMLAAVGLVGLRQRDFG
jgi:ABC-2 type transport system permease protein